MIERLSSAVERLLKVPPPPQPPAGSAESTRVFRAARGFLYRRVVEWALAQAGALAGIFFSFSFAASEWIPDRVAFFLGGYIRLFELAAVGLFAAQVVFSFLVLLLEYRQRYYIVTDRSLRIREGILRVREQTVSFANIQNVSVKQGPLQRLLGIADVEIRTAGGGGKGDDSEGSDNLHRAVFKGVDNAAQIRDIIRTDLRRLRDAGLGEAEPERAAEADDSGDVSLLAASRRLANAARDLRLGLDAQHRARS